MIPPILIPYAFMPCGLATPETPLHQIHFKGGQPLGSQGAGLGLAAQRGYHYDPLAALCTIVYFCGLGVLSRIYGSRTERSSCANWQQRMIPSRILPVFLLIFILPFLGSHGFSIMVLSAHKTFNPLFSFRCDDRRIRARLPNFNR
jgi:hypothetical protein